MSPPRVPESARRLASSPSACPPSGAPRRSLRLERWLARKLLASAGAPPLSLVLWDGEEVRVSERRPVARVRVADRRVLRDLALRPDPGACDAYVDSRLEIEGDLLRVLDVAFRAHRKAPPWVNPLRRAFRGWLHRRSVADVHHHYEIGDEFYRLWLDEQLVYTCAYFASPGLGLEEAQVAKMDHVCRKLGLRPGERVVEAGCGWGSLALHMARHYGVHVTALNVSGDQIATARDAARRAGLADRVDFVHDHYENIGGRYDAFVSVGMLEHVGRRGYAGLSRVIDRCLSPEGRGLIHSIGRARSENMSPWIERSIFPGAYIPALGEMLSVLEPADLVVLDVENLRRHYVRTLESWLQRFEKASERVEAMFDERFVRAWRLYLASSIASFRSGSCQLFQIAFARKAFQASWTRAGLYREDRRRYSRVV